MNDAADLRHLFRERETGAPRAGECPTADRIWEAALDRSQAAEFRDVLEHTAICPACATAWRMAREFGRDQIAGGKQVRRRFGPWAAFAAAAALLIAVGSFLVDPRQETSGPAAFRANQETAIEALLPDDAPLSREACVLRWSFDVAGARYHVRVMNEDLDLLFAADDLEATTVPVPREALAELPGGAWILWQVEARLPDGSRRKSPTFTHRLE